MFQVYFGERRRGGGCLKKIKKKREKRLKLKKKGEKGTPSVFRGEIGLF